MEERMMSQMACPPPDHKWVCKNPECRGESYGYDEGGLSLPPKCPKCDGEMTGGPIVHRGPSPPNPFLRY